MEEYVHISYERYKEVADTIKTLEKENDEYERILCEKNETIEKLKKNEFIIAGLKKAILKVTIDNYNIRNYSMESVTNPYSWDFAFKSRKKELLEVGVTIEEMIEYARTYKAQYEAEKAAEEEKNGKE